jgi:hypothetical protein
VGIGAFEEAIETETVGEQTEKNAQKRQMEDYCLEKLGIICRHQRRMFFMG